MGKRKRTWSDNYQSCSKRYRKEEFTNFRQFIHEAPDALRQIKGTKRVCSHRNLLAILQSCTQETSIKMVDCSSELTKVDSTLYERNNLESGDIIWIINILASAINDQPELVCSIIERSNFFERSDVSGMVLKGQKTLSLYWCPYQGNIQVKTCSLKLFLDFYQNQNALMIL